MFHRTRMRLTLLNTMIFFLILSMFGAALYFYVKIQLYNKIDASLLEEASNVLLTQNGPGDKLYYQAPEASDPRVFFITRDTQGSITSQSLDKKISISQFASPAMVATLPQKVGRPPTTMLLGGHHYRMLAVSNKINMGGLAEPLFIKSFSTESTFTSRSAFGFGMKVKVNAPGIGRSTMSASRVDFPGSRIPEEVSRFDFMDDAIARPVIEGGSMALFSRPMMPFNMIQNNFTIMGTSAGALSGPLAITATGTVMPLVTNASSISMTVASPIATMQFISNMDPEIEMLHSLFIIIIAGVAVGGLLTLLAGFYLAQRALVPIRDSWEKQQQFVADASHELRTPLAVIQANTELLLRHPDHSIEQESGYISTILKESKRINKLITSLLTFARSDSNQMEIQAKPISIDLLINECVQQFAPLMNIKQIDIKLILEEEMIMHADEERIHQLLVILMDNALKYTPENGVISISANKTAHSVNLSIEDTGVGIPESDLPFIFERFFRGDKVRSRSDGSMGLGLSIAHWIVDRHGGKIRAESKLGKGTRMLIHFPLRR
ncbi:sensor histidine kinase [Paenibacillus psychroresistens]|uniref:histidine kinase n=1 Tax=Paenibacillus psychroresistens TaxID=1778678 RepID=A0A6B8RHI0_9BACL|nr:HAMP domain-containing sensor histidine kinase [Paenibacillus psychroresistens]QGQ95529.1 sensor histidine kinase [Paenibacillus psychroresistens]